MGFAFLGFIKLPAPPEGSLTIPFFSSHQQKRLHGVREDLRKHRRSQLDLAK